MVSCAVDPSWKRRRCIFRCFPIKYFQCPSNCVCWYLPVNHLPLYYAFPTQCQYRALVWYTTCRCGYMLIYFSSEAPNSRENGVWLSGSELSTLHVIVWGLLRDSNTSWLKNAGLVFATYTLLISASWLLHPQLPDLFHCICLASPNFLQSQDTFKTHSLYTQPISILNNIFMRKVITYNDSGVSRFSVAFPRNSWCVRFLLPPGTLESCQNPTEPLKSRTNSSGIFGGPSWTFYDLPGCSRIDWPQGCEW